MPQLSIKEYQQTVDYLVTTNGVRYFYELTNLFILMEEFGEDARIMTRTYDEQIFIKGKENADLADELADVLFVAVCIANQTGIDLTAALEKNLEKKRLRDKERHWNNPKLAGE